jgi:hypothetical protein
MEQDPTEQLRQMLADAGIEQQPTYQPGEVQKILCISNTSFRRFCELWEPGRQCDHHGIESFRLATHRRVTHQALVDWIRRNHSYERDNT